VQTNRFGGVIELCTVPFGRSSVSLKQDLMDILVSTLDRIKQAHDGIAGPKGPDRRMRCALSAITG